MKSVGFSLRYGTQKQCRLPVKAREVLSLYDVSLLFSRLTLIFLLYCSIIIPQCGQVFFALISSINWRSMQVYYHVAFIIEQLGSLRMTKNLA